MQIPRVMGGSTGKKREIEVVSGVCGPSYPDRRRIDSDVRAFLRQPSTPWIVFDRASRASMPDVHGRVFRSAMSSVLASEGVFPTEPAPEVIVPSVEPSSLNVAADLDVPSAPVAECDSDSESVPFLGPRASRGKWFAAAGALLVAALGVFGAHSMGSPPPAHEAQAALHGPSVVDDAPPPALDAMPPAVANVAVAGVARAVTSAPAKPRRLGKLSLRGAAAYKRVYFDGKLLLGNRTRSFDVFCGEHTISVGVRNDEHEIDVPCGGEFVVTR